MAVTVAVSIATPQQPFGGYLLFTPKPFCLEDFTLFSISLAEKSHSSFSVTLKEESQGFLGRSQYKSRGGHSFKKPGMDYQWY